MHQTGNVQVKFPVFTLPAIIDNFADLGARVYARLSLKAIKLLEEGSICKDCI